MNSALEKIDIAGFVGYLDINNDETIKVVKFIINPKSNIGFLDNDSVKIPIKRIINNIIDEYMTENIFHEGGATLPCVRGRENGGYEFTFSFIPNDLSMDKQRKAVINILTYTMKNVNNIYDDIYCVNDNCKRKQYSPSNDCKYYLIEV